jgi:hypothetical protein
MRARVRLLALLMVAGCAHARPWRVTSTVVTTLDGESLRIDEGEARALECTANGDPLWGGCPMRSYPLYTTRVVLGTRNVRLGDSARFEGRQRPPRVVRARARRLGSDTFMLQLQTASGGQPGGWRICRLVPDGDYVCAQRELPVAPRDLDEAWTAALASGWDLAALLDAFGAGDGVDALAIERHEFYYLSMRWPGMTRELRARALAEAVAYLEPAAAARDAIHAINLLREHRDQLDADLAARFDAVLVRRYPRR